MRLIYENGRQVGSEPVGFYVYLWRHDDVDRYVGKGVNRRWAAHINHDPDDNNQRKYRYFSQRVAEMACLILAEGLASEEKMADRETAEIDLRGLMKDGTGPLLNDRRGGEFRGRRPRGSQKVNDHVIAWRACKHFPLNAKLEILSPVNPWRDNSPGGAFYAKVLTARPATIADAIHLSGMKPGPAQGHLRWLYTWGDYIAINGARHSVERTGSYRNGFGRGAVDLGPAVDA